MFTSWYLSQNAQGLKALFGITVICAAAGLLFCLFFKNGRTKSALLRAVVALAAADVLTELTFYLSYMAYFPGHEPVTEAARLLPPVIFPVLYFGCAGLLIKVFNDILSR